MDIHATLKTLSLEEKVKLLSGTPDDFVSIAGIPEKGIAPLKVRLRNFTPPLRILTSSLDS